MATSLDATLGALELSILLSSVLFGLATMQAYMYTQSPQAAKDRFWLRSLVAWVWGLDAFHQALLFIFIYESTVTHYGKPATLLQVPWHLSTSVIIQGLADIAVQAYFAYRVRILSQTIWLAILPWAICVSRIGIAVAVPTLAYQIGDLAVFHEKHGWLVFASLFLSTVVDLWNMTFLCYYLSRHRGTFQQTIHLVNRLMLFSVETGIITSMTAIALIICLFVMPHNFVWLSLLMIYSKLFSNALLVSLNGRSQSASYLSNTVQLSSGQGHSTMRTTVQVDRTVHLELSPTDGNNLHFQQDESFLESDGRRLSPTLKRGDI